MTDRELLEFAAKAAGFRQYISRHLGRSSFVVYDEEAYSETKERRVLCEKTLDWNPITDDGDALRLAVKLGIDISLYAEKGGRVYAQSKHLLGFGTDGTPSYQAHEFMKEEYNGDPLAATRRAIVRAAAEIGRQMP